MAEQVEEREDLEVLLREEDVFPPPEDFAKQANANDPAIYDEAEKDFEAWWESWAKKLDWFEPWQTVLDWDPPFAKWFKEGKINASHNCLDRHVEADKGDKVAFHWVGEDGDTKDVTYADLLATTKRFANVLNGRDAGGRCATAATRGEVWFLNVSPRAEFSGLSLHDALPIFCVTIFVLLVVWFLLPRVARLMIHTPTAISIFVCLSMVQLMAVFISMRCTLCGHFLQVALTLILVVGYAIAAS